VGESTVAVNSATLPKHPLRVRAQNHTDRLGAASCSKSSGRANLREATYGECKRLGSCSKDPIGYGKAIWDFYAYILSCPLSFVDPSGLVPEEPLSCSGGVVDWNGTDWCYVSCLCPNFTTVRDFLEIMPREISEEEWKDWGFPTVWPGTREDQCNERAEQREKLKICNSGPPGGGDDDIYPIVTPNVGPETHGILPDYSPEYVLCAWAITKAGGVVKHVIQCVRGGGTGTGGGIGPTIYPATRPLPIQIRPAA
jgi:hypothetical protein